MKNNYVSGQTFGQEKDVMDYARKKELAKGTGDEHKFEKVTVPGQSLTTKQILDRYKKGRPQLEE